MLAALDEVLLLVITMLLIVDEP